MLDVLLDTLIDTLKALPILYLVYLLVAFFSHKNILKTSKKMGPLVASALGQIPQCGFSSVMADLFSKKYITLGTLVSVFIATSDEAIPILLANPDNFLTILMLILIKFIFAVFFGYLLDYVFFRKRKTLPATNIEQSLNSCGIDVHQNHHECHHEDHCHDKEKCTQHNDCCADNIFLHALKHTAQIALYLLIASLIINFLVYFIGTETISKLLVSNSIFQPFITGIVGLIPSCAISVLLVELFTTGVLSFGSLVAGLCSGAGLGLIVLFTRNKNLKQNILIVGLLYTFSVFAGMIVNVINLFI